MNNYRVSPGLAISENGFLFNSNTGETFTSNSIAVRILNELKAGKDEELLKQELLNEYDVDEDRLEKDIGDFVSQLDHFRLLIK